MDVSTHTLMDVHFFELKILEMKKVQIYKFIAILYQEFFVIIKFCRNQKQTIIPYSNRNPKFKVKTGKLCKTFELPAGRV